MKLKSLLNRGPLMLMVIAGLLLFLVMDMNVSAVGVDIRQDGDEFGWDDEEENTDGAVYYMDGSTTVALTIIESRATNYDFWYIWYETASDVWRQPTADVTVKDSDSDGYVDWIGFTATGGDTAGGEVRIRGVAMEGRVPKI